MKKLIAVLMALVMTLSCLAVYAEAPDNDGVEAIPEIVETEPVAAEPVEAEEEPAEEPEEDTEPVEAEPIEAPEAEEEPAEETEEETEPVAAEPIEAPEEETEAEEEAVEETEEEPAANELLRLTLEVPYGDQTVSAVLYGKTEGALECALLLSCAGEDLGNFGFRYDDTADRMYLWASPLGETVLAFDGAEVESLIGLLSLLGAGAMSEDSILAEADTADIDLAPLFNALMEGLDVSFEDVAEVAASDAEYAEGIAFSSEAYQEYVASLGIGNYDGTFDMLNYDDLAYMAAVTVAKEDILNVLYIISDMVRDIPELNGLVDAETLDIVDMVLAMFVDELAQPVVCNIGMTVELDPVYFDIYLTVGSEEEGLTDFDFYVENGEDGSGMTVATVKGPEDEGPVVVLYAAKDPANGWYTIDAGTLDGSYVHGDIAYSDLQLEEDGISASLTGSGFTFANDAVTNTASAVLAAKLTFTDSETASGFALEIPLTLIVNDETLIDNAIRAAFETTTDPFPVEIDTENVVSITMGDILDLLFSEPEGELIEDEAIDEETVVE